MTERFKILQRFQLKWLGLGILVGIILGVAILSGISLYAPQPGITTTTISTTSTITYTIPPSTTTIVSTSRTTLRTTSLDVRTQTITQTVAITGVKTLTTTALTVSTVKSQIIEVKGKMMSLWTEAGILCEDGSPCDNIKLNQSAYIYGKLADPVFNGLEGKKIYLEEFTEGQWKIIMYQTTFTNSSNPGQNGWIPWIKIIPETGGTHIYRLIYDGDSQYYGAVSSQLLLRVT